MSSKLIASFMTGIQLWETTADPNGLILPITRGSLAVVDTGGIVALWQCTALPSTWTNLSTLVSGVPLSKITAAIASNSIDSLTFAQTWAWSTATTQTPLTLSGAALTTGSLLALSSPGVLQTAPALKVSSASAAAVATGIVSIDATGAYTGGSALRVATATAAGVGVTVTSSTLVSGSLVVAINSSAGHTGQVLSLATNTTAAINNGALRVNGTGAHVSGNLVQIESVTTAGTVAAFLGNSLVGGTLVSLNSTSAGLTGKLLNVATASTGAFGAGCVSIAASGAHTGALVNVSDVTATGTVIAATTTALTTGHILDLQNSSAVYTGAGLLSVENTNAATTGTLVRFKTSSAALSGITVLCSGFTGFGIEAPVATIHNAGSNVKGTGSITNKAGGGDIGTAAATVDLLCAFACNQTTAAQTLTLPPPTNTTPGRTAVVMNVGTQSFTLYGQVVTTSATPLTAAANLIWMGTAWVHAS